MYVQHALKGKFPSIVISGNLLELVPCEKIGPAISTTSQPMSKSASSLLSKVNVIKRSLPELFAQVEIEKCDVLAAKLP